MFYKGLIYVNKICYILIQPINYLFHIKIPWALSLRRFYDSLNNMSLPFKIISLCGTLLIQKQDSVHQKWQTTFIQIIHLKPNAVFLHFRTLYADFQPSEKQFAQISDCSKDVSGHFGSLKPGQDSIPSEEHLLLLKIAFFSPTLNNFNICPNHRAKLGLKWKRHNVKCSYPDHSHNGTMGRTVTPQMSRFILEHKEELVPVGSGQFQDNLLSIFKRSDILLIFPGSTPPCGLFFFKNIQHC